jgi:predicted O-methyltransferase YrrM
VKARLRRLAEEIRAGAARESQAPEPAQPESAAHALPVEDDTHGQPVDLAGIQLPMAARHAELSLIASLDDSPGRPDTELMRIALDAAREATQVDLTRFHGRSPDSERWLSVFPGEHYQLLSGLVRVLQPQTVVEVGTFTGLSALAILDGLPHSSRLTTFDVVPWDALAEPALIAEDFAGGRLVQVVADLAIPERFGEHAGLLASADLMFVDGPKDGRFEPAFWALLSRLPRTRPCLVMFDDVRVWSMLGFWRGLAVPKLDVTSFGHWSGTGLLRLDP